MSYLRAIICCVVFGGTLAQDDTIFGFAVDTTDTANMAPSNRTAIQSTLCRDDELYYPGEKGNDGVCDCKPGYAYHPTEDKCYHLFQQGFCKPGKYIALGPDGYTPVCKLDVCSVSKKVLYNRTCVRFGDPCQVPGSTNPRMSYAVDENTLQVECLEDYALVRIGDQPGPETSTRRPAKCPKGSKRRFKNTCN